MVVAACALLPQCCNKPSPGETFVECDCLPWPWRSDNDGVTPLPNPCSVVSDSPVWHDAKRHGFCLESLPAGCDGSADCLGRCGASCGSGGKGRYYLDCAEHDRCCRVHDGCSNPFHSGCGDEFWEAADDFFFGSTNCAAGCGAVPPGP